MMFGKKKKEEELRALQELEQKRIEEEKLRAEKLQQELEAEKKRAAEEAAKIVPYKFSVPNPQPKELISVLTNMLKKTFPETKKAYLVLTELDEKKGYLLVVDIDAKFYKIIHMYLDGETKKVRNGLPIECILYSKSGSLTENMEPFYKKINPEEGKSSSKIAAELSDMAFSTLPDYALDELNNELKKEFEEASGEEIRHDEELSVSEDSKATAETAEAIAENAEEDTPAEEIEAIGETATETAEEEAPAEEIEIEATGEAATKTAEEEAPAEEIETEATGEAATETAEEEAPAEEPANEITEEKTSTEESIPAETPKIRPETKQQLFIMMNRVGSNPCDDTIHNAREGFGEFKFYIPYLSETKSGEFSDAFVSGSRPVLLINRDNGIKVVVFFTDKEEALKFAEKSNCSIAAVKYKDYKAAIFQGVLAQAAAEGIIINPENEQILLAPDYCLL